MIASLTLSEIRKEYPMAYTIEQEFIDWVNLWDAWHKWASQKPSLKHPIKYIKWYFSEPKYEKWKKGQSK